MNDGNKETVYPPLTDREKEKLVLDHKHIVQMVSKKYRFFDSERAEIEGWGFLGLAKAISIYDKDRDHNFLTLAYTKVKLEIINQYAKKENIRNVISLQSQVGFDGDSNSKTLEETLVIEDQISFTEGEILAFIKDALFEETELNKKINMDWLMNDKDYDEISKECGISKALVKRTQRRGQALIKMYLINNDIIFDYLMHPSEERKKERKIINHRNLTSEDFGKIKYILRYFPFLNVNDIAVILDTSSFAVSQLLDYPTPSYIKSYPDESIKEKALRYCKKKYPERLPGPVVVSRNENKIRA